MNIPFRRRQPALSFRTDNRRKKYRFAFRAAVLAVLAIAAWCGALYYQIASFRGMDATDPATGKADAGIVLGASLRNDRPSPALKERLDQALSLYHAGVFPRFIVTGGLDAGGATITEAEGMRNYLVEQGVPADAISLDTKSRSTYENLQFAQDILEREGWRTAVIVTHSYHGARAADMARTLGYEPVLVSVTDTRVMNMAYHKTREVLAFAKWKLNKLGLAFG